MEPRRSLTHAVGFLGYARSPRAFLQPLGAVTPAGMTHPMETHARADVLPTSWKWTNIVTGSRMRGTHCGNCSSHRPQSRWHTWPTAEPSQGAGTTRRSCSPAVPSAGQGRPQSPADCRIAEGCATSVLTGGTLVSRSTRGFLTEGHFSCDAFSQWPPFAAPPSVATWPFRHILIPSTTPRIALSTAIALQWR